MATLRHQVSSVHRRSKYRGSSFVLLLLNPHFRKEWDFLAVGIPIRMVHFPPRLCSLVREQSYDHYVLSATEKFTEFFKVPRGGA